MRIGSYINHKHKLEATMRKALLLFIVLVLMIPVSSNAQHELWVDSTRVFIFDTGGDSVTVYQHFYSRKATDLDSVRFIKLMTGVLNGYNDGTCVIRIDSVTASMDTDSIQWKIEKLAHDGRTIDSTSSTFYVNTSNALTTTVTWIDWVPSNKLGVRDFQHWVDLSGEMIDPHCLGLRHTFTMRCNDAGAGTTGVAHLTLITYMVRTVR